MFGDDTEAALNSAVALVNSAVDQDTLRTVAELDEFVARHRWTGDRQRDRAELEQVQALRPRLASWWNCSEEQLVDEVNALLAEHRALPQLVRHDSLGWHIHAVPAAAPLATRMAVEAAMAVIDVIRAGELDRLRHCASATCDNVLVDLSRNRSRRFCDGGCGNRANVAAYRARKRG